MTLIHGALIIHVKDFSRIILEIFNDKNFDKVKNQSLMLVVIKIILKSMI